MATTVKLEGFKELDAALGELTKAAGKGVLRRALKKASEPLAQSANLFAPVGLTSALSQSFHYSTKLNNRQSGMHRRMFRNSRASVEGFVGTNDPAGVQQEFGNINHGPQPALRPAWDQEKHKMLERLKIDIRSELDKAIARAQRKAARAAGG